MQAKWSYSLFPLYGIILRGFCFPLCCWSFLGGFLSSPQSCFCPWIAIRWSLWGERGWDLLLCHLGNPQDFAFWNTMLLCLPSSDHFMMWRDQALEGTSFDFSVPLLWLDFLLEVGQITYLHWFLGVFYKIDIIPNRKVLKQVNSWGFFLFKF